MESDLGVYRVTTSKVDRVLARQRFEMARLPVRSIELSNRFLVVVYEDESYAVFWAERSSDPNLDDDMVCVMPTPAPLYLLVEVGLLSHEDGHEQMKLEIKQIEELTEKRERELLKHLTAKYGGELPAPSAGELAMIDAGRWAMNETDLTTTERDILLALAQANGKAVTYDDLIKRIGAHAYDHERNIGTLHAHKCRLSKKLKPQWRIGVACGVGYSLVEV